MSLRGKLFSGIKGAFLSGAVVVVVAALSLWFVPVIRENAKLRQMELQKQAQVKQQEAKNESLRAAIEALKTDERVVEAVVRDKLHYARPDEIVIHFTPAEN